MIGTCIKSTPELEAAGSSQIVTGADVRSEESCKQMAKQVREPIDVLINNAGYFYEPVRFV